MAYLACANTVMPDQSISLVGQNKTGENCVHETHGLIGGPFINRAEAIRFAQLESQSIPGSIVLITPRLIESGRANDNASDRLPQAGQGR